MHLRLKRIQTFDINGEDIGEFLPDYQYPKGFTPEGNVGVPVLLHVFPPLFFIIG